jgi:DNA polymerase I-like protein with 3'-5' exonuclease and polymerase domains
MREHGRMNLDVPPSIYLGTDEEASEFLRLCIRKIEVDPGDPLGFDTETHGLKINLTGGKRKPLDWMRDTVLFWSLSFKQDGSYKRYCLPQQQLHRFVPLLENPKALLVVWNLKYDAHVCWNSGIDLWNSGLHLRSKGPIDVEAMGYLVDENLQGSMSLKNRCAAGLIEGELAAFVDFWDAQERLEEKYNRKFEHDLFDSDIPQEDYRKYFENLMRGTVLDAPCGSPWKAINMTKFKELFGDKDPVTGKKIKEFETNLLTLPIDKVADYASLDAYAHLKQYEHAQALLERIECGTGKNRTMWDYFLEMETGITKVLWRIERRGYPVDVDYLMSLVAPIEAEMAEIEKEINRAAGRPVNLSSSSPQLGQWFFAPVEAGGLGLKPLKMTKGGERAPKPSLDEEVLNKYALAGVPEAKRIVRHRSLWKTKSTYIEALIFLSKWHKDGRVHSQFNQFGARTGRFSSTTPNCVDHQTEYLTPTGWLKVKDLRTGMKVAQWDAGVVTFVEPIRIIREHYKGEMISLKNQHIDLLVTPDHRCPLRDRRTGALKDHLAKEYLEDKHQLHGGMFYGPEGRADLSAADIILIAATQADGSWHDGGIDFGFKKQRKTARLLSALDALGIPYSVNHGEARTRFRIKTCDFVQDLRDLLGEEKKFGPWLLDLSREQLDLFVDEVLFWDAQWAHQTQYASKHVENADWVQIAFVLSGKRANVRVYDPNPFNKEGADRRSLSYQIDVTHRDYSLTTNIERTAADYSDEVFCVEVPSSYILVRRNGKVCVTGNSMNLPRPDSDEWGIRKAFVADPVLARKAFEQIAKEIQDKAKAGGAPRQSRLKLRSIVKKAVREETKEVVREHRKMKLIVADYEQLEMRIMAHFSGDKGMIAAIWAGKDLHCETVSRMFPGCTYEEVYAAKKTKDKWQKGDEPLSDRVKQLCRWRQEAKTIGFALIYGAGAQNIAGQLGISKDEAQEKINAFFHAYPGVKAFMDDTRYEVKERGFVTTLIGRLRRLPTIWNTQFMIRAEAEREAINSPIQGSAADLIKAAMLNIENDEYLRDLEVEIINQIHDELVIACPDENCALAEPWIREFMEHPFEPGTPSKPGKDPLDVPTPCNIKTVDNWAEAK